MKISLSALSIKDVTADMPSESNSLTAHAANEEPFLDNNSKDDNTIKTYWAVCMFQEKQSFSI